MFNFTVDARDGANGSVCNTCCCKTFTMRPGETNKVSINYAPWSLPLLGKGLSEVTQFTFDNIHSTLATNTGNVAPVFNGGNLLVTQLPENTNVTVDVGAVTVDATTPADTLTYKVVSGPNYGTAVLTGGSLVYTPNAGWTGYDRVWISISDGVNKARVYEIVFVVQPTLPTPQLNAVLAASPAILIEAARKRVIQPWHVMEFPVTVNPSAVTGDVYRLSVRQQALDCDCNPYWHVSCYDITIGNC